MSPEHSSEGQPRRRRERRKLRFTEARPPDMRGGGLARALLRPGLFAVMVAAGLMLFAAGSSMLEGPQTAQADGPNGTPAQCFTDIKVDDVTDGTTIVTYNSETHEATGGTLVGSDPGGALITGVCVKSGNDEPNGGHFLYPGTGSDCYMVAGLGTTEVTITEVDGDGCQDISHVDITTGEVETGEITATKSCTSEETPQFEFTLFNDSDVAVGEPITVGCGEAAVFTGLPAGNYDVEETSVPDGWEEVGNTCVDLNPLGDVSSCTITNQESEGQTGQITVLKSCESAGAPQFEFTLYNDNGTPGNLVDDFAVGDPMTVDCGESAVFSELPAGNYYVVETSFPDGWDEVSNTCADLNPLDVEETCTITNQETVEETGQITVLKSCESAGTPQFEFTLYNDNGTPGNLVDDFAVGDPMTVDCGESAVFSELPAGNYYVEETGVPDGWVEASNTCADLNPLATEETCTITNREVVVEPGGLRAFKDCDPEDADGLFRFTLYNARGPVEGVEPQDVGCGESVLFAPLEPGTYSVQEEILEGKLVQKATTCDDVVVNPGRPVAECRITNKEVRDPAKITIVKETKPETHDVHFWFGGDLGGFSLADDGSKTFDVEDGVYTVDETELDGWSLIDIDCRGLEVHFDYAGTGVTIKIDDGEKATCVFVNEKDKKDDEKPPPPKEEDKDKEVKDKDEKPRIHSVDEKPKHDAKPDVKRDVTRIKPPSTGSGGLVGEGNDAGLWLAVAGVAGLVVSLVLHKLVVRREE